MTISKESYKIRFKNKRKILMSGSIPGFALLALQARNHARSALSYGLLNTQPDPLHSMDLRMLPQI